MIAPHCNFVIALEWLKVNVLGLPMEGCDNIIKATNSLYTERIGFWNVFILAAYFMIFSEYDLARKRLRHRVFVLFLSPAVEPRNIVARGSRHVISVVSPVG